MTRRRKRKLDGLFKRCACRKWNDCAHPWWFAFKPKGQPQVRESLGTASRAEAKNLRDRRRTQLNDGPVKERSPVTVDEVADRYVAARGGARDYQVLVLKKHLGAKPFEAVTAADLLLMVDAHRKEMTRTGGPGGAVGIRKVMQTARHLWNWAIDTELTERSPFYRGGRPVKALAKLATPSPGRDRRLEVGEEARLLEHADGYTHATIVGILDTGLRGGSLRLLQWADVEHDGDGTPTHLVVPPSKIKRGKRTLRVPVKSARLRRVLEGRRNGPDGRPLPAEAFVFGNAVGERMKARVANDLWRATCERANVKDLNFHDLRGEFGSAMTEANVPIHEVRDALGHSSITMTNNYLRARTSSLDGAYERLERARVVAFRARRKKAG